MYRPALALAATIFASPLTAQENLHNAQFGDWTVDCEALAKTSTCILQQSFKLSSDQSSVAQILLFWKADASKRYIAMRVPLGAYLPSGVEIRAEDEKAAQRLVWQSCIALGCDAVHDLSAERLQAFADNGGTALAGYVPALGQEPLVFKFSMAGAVEGLEALRPTAQ